MPEPLRADATILGFDVGARRIGVAVSIFATLAVAVIIYKGTAEKIRQQLLDGLAVDEPHRHVQPVVDLTEIVDRHDVRLIQPGSRMGLPAETHLVLLVVGEGRRQHLHGHDALHGGVVGLPDLTHAATTEQLNQPVPAERCPFHGLTIRGGRVSG